MFPLLRTCGYDTISDIVHRLAYLKIRDLETGLCLHFQAEPTQMDPTERDSDRE
jgi:hypothetical protein